MKVVIAPDSFKECLTALQAADAIETGWLRVWPESECVKVPMADGGEGTVRSLVDATGGKIIKKQVTGPEGKPVNGFFGLLGGGDTAVIEMAAAAGLDCVPRNRRNPLKATTFGVGELILAALDRGVSHIILGLGGSATNDGGCGMAQALGAKLLDSKGYTVGPGGAALAELVSIDLSELDSRIANVRFDIATDVSNPLTGSKGAAAVFAPQKGASPEDVRILDEALVHFAHIVRKDLDIEIDRVPGAGAAGGLGAGALCFLGGTICPGVDTVIRAAGLEEKMQGASLVITGEGKIDGQTLFGKTPVGVARCAKKSEIPVIALAGSLADGSRNVYRHGGIDALFSIVPGAVSLEDALAHAETNLSRTAENIALVWRLAQHFPSA